MTTVTEIGSPVIVEPAASRVPRPGFDHGVVADLPEPARRWLCHAIADGTKLHSEATITMHGMVRLARGWRAFTATEHLAPELGFTWTAQTKIAQFSAHGYDGYTDGNGTSYWRMLGHLSLRRTTGLDATRSAIDRLAAESVLIPTTLLDAHWRAGTVPGTATFTHPVAGRRASSPITVRVNPDGRLRLITMGRWGNPGPTGYAAHGFRVDFAGERRVQGIATPIDISAAWLLPDGSWHEAFRAQLDSITFADRPVMP